MELLEIMAAEREIGKLLALYPQHADDGDAEAFGALFADDGELVAGGETITGPAAIAQWLRQTLTRGKMRHLMMNAHIDVISPDHATGSMDMMLQNYDKAGNGWRVVLIPRYTDSYVKTPDGWKIARRKLDPFM